MAFEDGFDYDKHYEPIVSTLKNTPNLKEKLNIIMKKYIENNISLEKLYHEIGLTINDSWVTSCLIQYLIYNEENNDAISFSDRELVEFLKAYKEKLKLYQF
ncbi:MAG: hypothetical protein M1308_18960 [Actinobacteria bacterium]|nr:hypothetical protein [Actinomycetota bacterium]